MKHISLKNFDENEIKKHSDEFKSNIPFKHIVIDNFLVKDSADKVLDNFKINKNWINYSFVNNYKKYGLIDRKYMDKNLNEIFDELSSKQFSNFLSKITGINNVFLDKALGGGGLNQVFNGGSLNIHTDFTSHITEKKWKRVLNLLIYLNHDWLDEYNGKLEFWDEKVEKRVKSISPIFNRCVIFKTDKKSFHGHPEKLQLPPDKSRKSIQLYYLVEEETVQNLHTTRYVGRPKDSFYYKFLIFIDTFLNKIFTFLKRYHILNDKIASKILNLFK